MHSLPLFLKLAGQPVLLIGTGEAARAKARLIERAGGVPVDEGDARAGEARIAFIALEDDAAAADMAARLKARGLLVNVVDRPELCDFTTPAIVDRDPVLIAVGTGGASAGLAAALRQRLEALLPARLGDQARALKAARGAIRALWLGAADRRRALGAALAPGGPLDPLKSEHDLEGWLAAPHMQATSDLVIIRPRSADPDDLTLREARALAQADRVVHSPETPAVLLARARADAQRIIVPSDAPIPPAPGLTVRIEITAM